MSFLSHLNSLVGGRRAVAVAALFTAVSLSACHQVIKDPKDPRFVVAETKNWAITRAELDDEVARFVKFRHKTMKDVDAATLPRVEAKVLKDIVVKKLMLAKAEALPAMNIDQEVEKDLAEMKKQAPSEAAFEARLKETGITDADLKKEIHDKLLIQKFVESDVLKNAEPSESDINTFYEHNKSQMEGSEQRRVSRIMVATGAKASAKDKAAKKKQIEAARARVIKGEDFVKVAGSISEDHSTAGKGGDLGFVQKGQNEAAFDQVAFSSPAGSVSPVFEIPTGYEFIKVMEVKPAKIVTLQMAHESIAQYLRRMKEGFAVHFYLKKLVEDSGVVYHLPALANEPAEAPAPSAGTNGMQGAVPAEPPTTNR